jgi:RNA recognition motif-containing protein
MTNKLYVAGLAYDVTENELKAAFSAVGTPTSVKIIMDRDTNQSKGFGFVEMSSEEEAQKAMSTLNNTDLKGRSIIVKEARPQMAR